jgi:hypothetical protein
MNTRGTVSFIASIPTYVNAASSSLPSQARKPSSVNTLTVHANV